MLEKIASEKEIPKEEYSSRLSELEPLLFHMEWKAREAGVPTLILIEGLAATGKGDAIRALTTRLDPRSLRVHPIREPRGLEKERPWLYRFWMRLPNYGEMAVFDTSWYRHVIDDRARGECRGKEARARVREINQLERALVEDGHVLVKLWFHISKKEQTRRLLRAEKDKRDFWDVSEEEWEQNRRYKRWVKIADEVMEATSHEKSPWVLLNAETPRRARLQMFEVIIQAMQSKIATVAPSLEAGPAPGPQDSSQTQDSSQKQPLPPPARAKENGVSDGEGDAMDTLMDEERL